MRALALALALALAVALPGALQAVQPDEVLDDPALEARAREISREVRCVVCRSETIDESNADIARDLRLLVRERLLAGDSDQEVLDFLVERYGEYVLFRPPMTLKNAALWLSGPVLLILGGGMAFAFVRRRSRAVGPVRAPLSPQEQERLDGLLED